MASFISKFILAVGIHGLKNKALTQKLDTYWINEELSIHGRYSPFLLEVQKNQDLKSYFWSLCIFTAFVLVVGLILCACSHWTIQWAGIAVCLLATSMISNIGKSLWHSYKTGNLQTKEAA